MLLSELVAALHNTVRNITGILLLGKIALGSFAQTLRSAAHSLQPLDVEASATLVLGTISRAYMLPWAAHVECVVIRMSLLESDQLAPLVKVGVVFLILCTRLLAPRLAVEIYV